MSKQPPSETAAELVQRAYTATSPEEALALYREWASTYDEAMVGSLKYLTPKRTAELLARHLSERDGGVLDVGCGTGLAGAELAEHGFSGIDGIDLSHEMLEVAQQRGIYRALFAADLLEPLDIESKQYDGAICTGTFTHAHVGAQCIDELFRVLKPGGVFAFTVHLDVWDEMGFATRLGELQAQRVIDPLEIVLGPYYEGNETEGRYCAYRKR